MFKRWLICYEAKKDQSICRDDNDKFYNCYKYGRGCEDKTWFKCYWKKIGCTSDDKSADV